MAQRPSAADVAKCIRLGGELPDQVFDQFLGPDLQRVAWQHWTPICVAQRVACWLREFGISGLVDIGSGVGKFCVVAAIAAPDCSFWGIEQRFRLVSKAEHLIDEFGLSKRVSIHCGVFGRDAIPNAEAYYLFNPFGENLHRSDGMIDQSVELSYARHAKDVSYLTSFLEERPKGTVVIKYNGFGGRMPRHSYEVLRTDRNLPRVLRLWRRI